MVPAILAKPAVKILLIALVALAITYGFYHMYKSIASEHYEAGVQATDAKWLKVREKEQTDEARERSRIAEDAAKARRAFIKSENLKDEKIKKLKSDIGYMYESGLYIDIPTGTNENCTGGEGTDQQKEGATKRVRLSQNDEGKLIKISEKAQEVVLDFNELSTIVSNLPCVEIVE